MRLYDEGGILSRDIEWTLEYNDLNQLTKRYSGASWTGAIGDRRISYTYDDNGNLIETIQQENMAGGIWDQLERWVYDWNPRDQMTRAMKWDEGLADNTGSVEYQYCLACDGALSKRFVYDGGSGTSRGALESGQRYEYDGLNLMRVDEIYGATLSEGGPWRTLEISTHQPGQLGALLHKRVYIHTDNDAAPDQTKDFTYSYDPVGNVYSVFDSNGNEAYYFTQDAFGNELPITTLGGDDWDDARDDRIVEHQTGKWIDEFTELYYFHARWYDSGVGRFVGRDPKYVKDMDGHHPFIFVLNLPTTEVDPTGRSVMSFLECLGDCIRDNDPLDSFLEKALLELSGQLVPKTWVAALWEFVGNRHMAALLRAELKNPCASRLTTIPSTLSAQLRMGGRSTLRMLGRYVWPIWAAYAGALASVEAACVGQCLGDDTYCPGTDLKCIPGI